MKYVILDHRLPYQMKEYLKTQGYFLIEIPYSSQVYDEISSHADIFCCKIDDTVILEPTLYRYISSRYKNSDMISSNRILCGSSCVKNPYPKDIAYNCCQIGKYCVHSFKYTDKIVEQVIEEKSKKVIDIKQGYSNCSIAVIDDKSVIVTDKSIENCLEKEGIDVLCLEEKLSIQLLTKEGKISKMPGFLGGSMVRIEDTILVMGELSKIDKDGKIQKFILEKGLKIKDFIGLDVIDGGGIFTY